VLGGLFELNISAVDDFDGTQLMMMVIGAFG
jgi:hypothetical protein